MYDFSLSWYWIWMIRCWLNSCTNVWQLTQCSLFVACRRGRHHWWIGHIWPPLESLWDGSEIWEVIALSHIKIDLIVTVLKDLEGTTSIYNIFSCIEPRQSTFKFFFTDKFFHLLSFLKYNKKKSSQEWRLMSIEAIRSGQALKIYLKGDINS